MAGPASIEFGVKEVLPVPWADLNVLTQTRGSNVNPTDTEELLRSIEALDENGQPQYEMLHPPLVNMLNPKAATTYVGELNIGLESNHTMDELHPNAGGNFVIVVAGHRRRLVAGMLIDKYGADPRLSTVACNVRHNLAFDKALRLQLQENTHLQLPVYEVARAIQATYRYGLATRRYNSIADCVRDLPFSDDKVRNALKFCELPNFLQEWVEDDRIRYGAAVALHPLIDGFRNYYGRRYDTETSEMIAMERLEALGLEIMEKQLSREVVSDIVRERLNAMAKQSDLVLFTMDEIVAAQTARQRAYAELFKGGLGRLRHFAQLADGGRFTSLPRETQEAVLEELDEFRAMIGKLVTRQGILLPK